MKSWYGLLGWLLLALVAGGCSDSNSGSSLPNAPHPVGWILLHGDEANADLRGCQVCHGADFAGSGGAVSCFSCHFDGPPPFFVHPASWQAAGAFGSHFGAAPPVPAFAEQFSWTTCAVGACHGGDSGRSQ